MDKEIFDLIELERKRQEEGLELIASENFVSQEVMRAVGSVCTNKYAEGLPGKRYYGGCEIVDQIEQIAIDRAKELFGASWANVQPHSGSQANAAVMLALLNAGDRILGFDLSHGGHLTHGSPVNFSGILYQANFYGVDPDSGRVNMEHVADMARQSMPKLIICGASSYSRDWDYAAFRKIADEVGAILLADVAHPAGLIVGKHLNNPMQHCHVVTTTTHKTLRGPRGGMILVGHDMDNPFGITDRKGNIRSISSLLDSAVFPGSQGGPLEHTIAGKAVAFLEDLQPEFRTYGANVIENAQSMAKAFIERGYKIISDGTDNHLMLIDLRNKFDNLTGRLAEDTLVRAHITINKNTVPNETRSPFVTSGIRLGTAAMTTRGLGPSEMVQIVDLIDDALLNHENDLKIEQIGTEVKALMRNFPLYEQLSYNS